jgi:hypothetical protein
MARTSACLLFICNISVSDHHVRYIRTYVYEYILILLRARIPLRLSHGTKYTSYELILGASGCVRACTDAPWWTVN